MKKNKITPPRVASTSSTTTCSRVSSAAEITEAIENPEVSPQQLRELLQRKAAENNIDVRTLVNKPFYFLSNEKDKIVYEHCNVAIDPLVSTYVHSAMQYGSAEKLHVLLEAKPNLELVDHHGYTPLVRAILKNNFRHVRYLLQAGASLFSIEPHSKLTPVGLAIHINDQTDDYLPTIKELLASPSALLSQGKHILPKESSPRSSTVKSFVHIIYHLARIKKEQDSAMLLSLYLSRTNEFPLHTLAGIGHPDLIRGVYEEYPSASRLFTEKGDYPLHIALYEAIAARKEWGDALPSRHLETLRELLHCDRETVTYRNQAGLTPLHLAVRNREFRLIKLFLAAGGNPDAPIIIQKEGEPDVVIPVSPRALAHKGGFGSQFEHIIAQCKIEADATVMIIVHNAEEKAEQNKIMEEFFAEGTRLLATESLTASPRREQRVSDAEKKLSALPDEESGVRENRERDERKDLARIHTLYKDAGERLQLLSLAQNSCTHLQSEEADELTQLKSHEQGAKKQLTTRRKNIGDLSAAQGNLRKDLANKEAVERTALTRHLARLTIENAESKARTEAEKKLDNVVKKIRSIITGKYLTQLEGIELQSRHGIEAAQDGESLQALTPLALAICLRNFPMVHFLLSQGHNAREASPSLESSTLRSPFAIAKSYQESEAPGEQASSKIFNLILQQVGTRHNPYSL